MNHFRDGIVCLPMRPDSQLHHFPKVTKKSATTGWNHNFRAIQRNDDGGSKENSYGTTIGFQDRNRYYFPRIQGHDDPCHRIVHYLLIPRIHVARFFHFEDFITGGTHAIYSGCSDCKSGVHLFRSQHSPSDFLLVSKSIRDIFFFIWGLSLSFVINGSFSETLEEDVA